MPQNLTKGGHVAGSLVTVVIVHLPVKDPEKVVVCTSNDFADKGVKEIPLYCLINQIMCGDQYDMHVACHS